MSRFALCDTVTVMRRGKVVTTPGALVKPELLKRPRGGNADDLSRFDDLHALARDIAPLTEGHNYWIDREAQATRRDVARVDWVNDVLGQ